MFDGSITIDTRIDTKGFKKGSSDMSKSLGGVLNTVKNIAKLMAAAFVGGSIINGIRGIVQSFDLMGSAVGEKIKPLTDALNILKGTFVNLIVQALIPLIPYIVTAVEWFTRMLSTVTQVVAALFGYKTTVGNIMTKAASDAKKSAKEVKGALAAFDQINVLQKKEAPITGGDTGATATPAPITISQELLDKVEAFKQKVMDFLKPAIELFLKLKEIVVNVVDKITTWVKENPEKVKLFITILGLLVLAFLAVVAVVLIVAGVVSTASSVIGFFIAVFALLFSPIGLVVIAIGLLIAAIWLLIQAWKILPEVARLAWDLIKAVWTLVDIWFRQHVTDPMKSQFTTMLNFIRDKFISIFTGIQTFVRGVIDNIIGFINDMVQSILAGIAAITGISNNNMSVGVGGVSNFRLPGFATGAVIPPNAQFAAILGDQRSGRNIEAPEGLIRQIVREETGKMEANISISFEGSLAALVRELKPRIDKENIRVGGNLINGTAPR